MDYFDADSIAGGNVKRENGWREMELGIWNGAGGQVQEGRVKVKVFTVVVLFIWYGRYALNSSEALRTTLVGLDISG